MGAVGFSAGSILGFLQWSKAEGVLRDQVEGFATGMFAFQVEGFATGISFVDRDDFNSKFDLGVPYDPSDSRNRQLLILHGHKRARLSNFTSREGPLPLLSIEEATKNCDYVNVVLTDHGKGIDGERRQCVAALGQSESYHVHKFMRLPEEGALDPKVPLRYVHRSTKWDGNSLMNPPGPSHTEKYRPILMQYMVHAKSG